MRLKECGYPDTFFNRAGAQATLQFQYEMRVEELGRGTQRGVDHELLDINDTGVLDEVWSFRMN